MKKNFLLFSLVIILFSACKKGGFDATKQATIDDDKIKAYIAANHIDSLTKDPSGIYYRIITSNPGPHPTVSDTIQVSYTGKLLNGTIFDTEVATTFPLNSVVLGWQVILPKIGANGTTPYSRIRFILPSAYGYGNEATSGNTPIPANSVLDFELDLIGFYGSTAQ